MIRPLTCPVCNKPISGAAKSQTGSDASAFSPDDGQRVAAGAEVLPPQSAGSLPFCSERCRKIDLFRWFDGRYAIVEELSEEQLPAISTHPTAAGASEGLIRLTEPFSGDFWRGINEREAAWLDLQSGELALRSIWGDGVIAQTLHRHCHPDEFDSCSRPDVGAGQ